MEGLTRLAVSPMKLVVSWLLVSPMEGLTRHSLIAETHSESMLFAAPTVATQGLATQIWMNIGQIGVAP